MTNLKAYSKFRDSRLVDVSWSWARKCRHDGVRNGLLFLSLYPLESERGIEYISTVGISADRVRYICRKSLLPYKIFAPFISF